MAVLSETDDPDVTRKRGRPSREEEGEITTIITQTALGMFLKDGYGATSMKRIAETSQVSPGTLYARFPNKESLFTAVVELEVATLKVSNPVRRPKANASVRDILESCASNMMDALGKKDVDAFGRLLANEASRFPQLARIYRHATAIGKDEVIQWMRDAPDSLLNTDTAADVYQTLIEAVSGWSRMRIFTPKSKRSSIRPDARRIARIIAGQWDGKK